MDNGYFNSLLLLVIPSQEMLLNRSETNVIDKVIITECLQ